MLEALSPVGGGTSSSMIFSMESEREGMGAEKICLLGGPCMHGGIRMKSSMFGGIRQ